MTSTQVLSNPALGSQREWKWRGWRIRYSYHPAITHADEAPLLLIHGFGSSLTQWHENMQCLNHSRAVYALDLLGFGASEKAAIAYNSNLWVEQIYEFWRQYIGCPMVLVGHSLGALMAATVAVQHPDIVQRLVLVTVPNTRQDMVHSRLLQKAIGSVERLVASPLLVRFIFQVARRPEFIRKALNSIYIKRDRVTDDIVSQFVVPTLDRGAAQTLCRLTQSAMSPDYSPSRELLLREIQQDTLILWGQQDQVVPLKSCEQDIAGNPRLKLVTIPNGGHCVYDECAPEFNQTILDWLQARA